jgi:hypothetical protein
VHAVDALANVTESLEVRVATHLATDHISSAALFARLAGELEAVRASAPPDDPRDARMRHSAFVTGAIISSAAFLEAEITSRYISAAENPTDGALAGLGEATIRHLGFLWSAGIVSRASVLKKAQAMLSAAHKEPLAKGQEPVQKVTLLINLRNALLHYDEGFVLVSSDERPPDIQEMEKKLSTYHLPINPFAAAPEPFFPRRCLSHGLASWAVIAAIEFTDAFYARLESLPNILDPMRDQLSTG